MGCNGLVMKETAKRAALATLVVGGIVVAALALWKLKLVLALLFFAFIIAAAMRPGIEWLKRHRVPRGISSQLIGITTAKKIAKVTVGNSTGGSVGLTLVRD